MLFAAPVFAVSSVVHDFQFEMHIDL